MRDARLRTSVATLTLLLSASGSWAQSLISGTVFVPLTPCRIADTRKPSPSPIAGGATRSFNVVGLSDYSAQGGIAGTCGIPGFAATGVPTVTAIAVNVVAVTPSAQGNLVVYPTDVAAPTASTLNFPGPSVPMNIANGVIVPVRRDSPGADVTVKPTQTTHVLMDVTGYFTPLPVQVGLNSISPNLIGGFAGNGVNLTATGATIAGGGASGFVNRVESSYGTVGGGYGNSAGFEATIGGGSNNTAQGLDATVGGGTGNHAFASNDTIGGGTGNSGAGDAATVGGGNSNSASGSKATVGGGDSNSASGASAAVPGGISNVASGSASFAAGTRAKATHDGSFVWADSRPFDFPSAGTDTVGIRATGGMRFVTSIDNAGVPVNGCSINSSGNLACTTISGSSDRNAKQSFAKVDSGSVLRKVAAMPIETWTYKTDGAQVRHIGPMAQDFRKAFAVGEDDKHIATVDADGVALASIQGLYAMIEEDRRVIREERRAVAEERRESKKKDGEIAELRRRLATIEGAAPRNAREPRGTAR